jgi:virginiamycin A acetyltransferase
MSSKTNQHYRESTLLGKILVRMYGAKIECVRKLIISAILRREGAEFYSRTLRALFSRYHGVNIGMYSYGWFGSDFPVGTEIGRYCSLARGLLVLNGSHPIDRKSSHPFFYNPALRWVDNLAIDRRKNLKIGNDVYIGANVVLLPNVTVIGNGAVIGAGSVVVKDVSPFVIVGGNPAKIIRRRFAEEVIDGILISKWWEKDIEELIADEHEFASFLTPLK